MDKDSESCLTQQFNNQFLILVFYHFNYLLILFIIILGTC